MLSLHKDLQEKRSRFLRRLGENLEGVKLTTALQTFDDLDFAGFVVLAILVFTYFSSLIKDGKYFAKIDPLVKK